MEQIRYKWTDGADKDFQRFYLKTEEFYSSLVGSTKNRKGFIPYNISEIVSSSMLTLLCTTICHTARKIPLPK